MRPDWQTAHSMAIRGYGWEDLRAKCGLSEREARRLVFHKRVAGRREREPVSGNVDEPSNSLVS